MTTHSNVTASLEDERALVIRPDEPKGSSKEKQLADELIAAQSSLKEMTSANEALQSALDTRDAELARAVAERLVALTQLNAVTIQRRTLEVRLEAVEAQLGEALADRRRLLANLEDAETRHRQLSAEADRMQASQDILLERKQALEVTLEARQSELAKAVAERSVVLCRLEEMASDRHRLETKLSEHDARQEKLAAELEAAQLAAESGMRMVAEFGMERARLQQSIELMTGQHHAEALANRDVVVSALAEHLRRLTPLVATGRLARELAPQLRELVERVDGLASQVLDDCHLERQGRADLEMLRAEVVRAGALAGELMVATLDRDSRRGAVDRPSRATDSHP